MHLNVCVWVCKAKLDPWNYKSVRSFVGTGYDIMMYRDHNVSGIAAQSVANAAAINHQYHRAAREMTFSASWVVLYSRQSSGLVSFQVMLIEFLHFWLAD